VFTDPAGLAGGIFDLLAEFYEKDLPANGSSIALSAGLQVVTGQAYLTSFTILNTNAAAQYVQLHDVSAAPTTGAVPAVVFAVPATSNLVIAYTLPGRRFHRGVYIANSSTAATLTAGAADCFFDVQTIPAGLIS
jgi:hypothetical protein